MKNKLLMTLISFLLLVEVGFAQQTKVENSYMIFKGGVFVTTNATTAPLPAGIIFKIIGTSSFDNIIVSGPIQAGDALLTNQVPTLNQLNTSISNTSFYPYTIPFATSNNIILTNGNVQYYAPTNTSTIYLPAAATNQSHYLRLELDIGTNSFTIATNGFVNVLLSTNTVFSLYTNTTTTVICNRPYNTTNWYLWALKQ